MSITKEFLNQVGPGFCLAKWTQATIHLGTGLTHSCHHTKVNHIDAEAVQKDPFLLHNTEKKCSDRDAMRAGHRLPDCNYCWRVEDSDAGVSDRVRKSAAPWSEVDVRSIIDRNWEDTVKFPRSLEVSFSNACNLACAYCGPTFSSKWAEEVKLQGPYNINGIPYNAYAVPQILNRDYNPYIDAFWKWFPVIAKGLYEFRITGGEPLMSKETFKIIEMISKSFYENLDFAINTNGCPPDKTWESFCKKLSDLDAKKRCKSITVYASAEASGPQAEYIRDGLDWPKFKSNIELLLESTTNTKVAFMSTVTILSLPSISDFCDWVVYLKQQYGDKRVRVDFTQIKHPEFLDPKNFAEESTISWLETAKQRFVSTSIEAEKLGIIQNTVTANTQTGTTEKTKSNLRRFLEIYDQRRNKNFKSTFAEFDSIYQ